jgi:hypothetical protein
MPMVGRPKLATTLPKALPADAVAALLAALDADPQPRRRTDWLQRDRALILTPHSALHERRPQTCSKQQTSAARGTRRDR